MQVLEHEPNRYIKIMKGATFFIYSRSDLQIALKIAGELRESGVDIWMDQLELQPGERWDSAIQSALHSAKQMILVLSKSSVQSENVIDEYSFYLKHKKTIIPILVEECKIPFRLDRVLHIDFTKNYNASFQKLLSVLNTENSSKISEKQWSAEKIVEEVPAFQNKKSFLTNLKIKKQIFFSCAFVSILIIAFLLNKDFLNKSKKVTPAEKNTDSLKVINTATIKQLNSNTTSDNKHDT